MQYIHSFGRFFTVIILLTCTTSLPCINQSSSARYTIEKNDDHPKIDALLYERYLHSLSRIYRSTLCQWAKLAVGRSSGSSVHTVSMATHRTHVVSIGQSHIVYLSHNLVQAQSGDLLEFRFHRLNQTFIETSTATSCRPKPNGLRFGHQRRVRLLTSSPGERFFYLSQALAERSCRPGLVLRLQTTSISSAVFPAALEPILQDRQVSRLVRESTDGAVTRMEI